MKLHVKVPIVGGGVVGASIAYHLQKGGWKDIVLIIILILQILSKFCVK